MDEWEKVPIEKSPASTSDDSGWEKVQVDRPTPRSAPKSRGERAFENFGEPILEAGGMVAGGLLGGTVGTGGGPLGTVAGAVGGSSLGYAGAKELSRNIKSALGYEVPKRTPSQMVTEPLKNLGVGATYEMGGQLLGKGLEVAAPYVGRGVDALGREFTRRTIGLTQEETTQLARKAEQMGFKLEARQLAPDDPLATPGFSLADKERNENLFARLSSRATGEETENVTPAFLEKRQKDLGKQLDQIYNRNFTIDKDSVDLFRQISAFESRVFPAGQADTVVTARNLINRWVKAAEEEERKKIEQQIRRMMGGKKGRPLEPGIGDAPPVQARRDWPNLRTAGGENLPVWFDDVNKVVDELRTNLGIPDGVISVWTSESRRPGLFGQAWGTGHIIVNASSDSAGALDTALHELGHQMEFQQFMKAPREEQNSIIAAWREQHRNIPTGQKTVEFYRPVTSSKYPEASRTAVASGSYETNYLRNFAEWWAEQTSRWFTQTQAPTNVVEKFFKGVADRWKQIYSRAKEYLPMVPEVETYYKSRWNNPMIVQKVAQPQGGEATERVLSSFGEGVTAELPGAELQRLRSNLTSIVRNTSDGNERRAASEFITAMDNALFKENPELLERLKKVNRQYTATMTLAKGIEQNWIQQGKIDPSRLGQYVASNSYGYGTGTSTHPLYELGYMGQKLNMQSRVAGSQYPNLDTTRSLFGRKTQAITNALMRPGIVRGLQRKYSEQALRRRNKNP
jgi:hypothetical protein